LHLHGLPSRFGAFPFGLLLVAGLAEFCQGQSLITTAVGTVRVFPPAGLPALSTSIVVDGLTIAPDGNVYFASGYLVLKLSPKGVLTVAAGNGFRGPSGDGGPATSAAVRYSGGVCFDSRGNLYITEAFLVRKVTPDGIITTLAGNNTSGFSGDGGPATSAMISHPRGIAVDAGGNVYFNDSDNNRTRKVSSDGIITTVVGSGKAGSPIGGFSGDGGLATAATLNHPEGMALDGGGNLYIADSGNQRIRKVDNRGVITTVAGNGSYGVSGDGGQATAAMLESPNGVAIDGSGNLYIADYAGIRKVNPAGIIATVVKAPASAVAIDGSGNLYINSGGSTGTGANVSKVSADGALIPLAGTGEPNFFGDGGPATAAGLSSPQAVAFDRSGNLYIADQSNALVRKVNRAGIISTVAGNGSRLFSGDGGLATSAGVVPWGIAFDTNGNMYIADRTGRIRKVDTKGIITTVAGNGLGSTFPSEGKPATSVLLTPNGVAVDAFDILYIADGQYVRKIGPDGILRNVAGNYNSGIGFSGDGGPATAAGLSADGIALDVSGNIYIADAHNNRIRKVTTNGIITTLAGNGSTGFSGDGGPAALASLKGPYGLTVDQAGAVYFADSSNDRIRKVDVNGMISTVAGNGGLLFADGVPATTTSLNYPTGVALDGQGNLFIADNTYDRVREVLFATPPSFQVSPTALNFSTSAGGAPPATQTVRLATGVSGLPFTVTSAAPWLKASPGSGGMPASLDVMADASNLQPGSYSGTLTVAAPLSATPPQSVSASLTVTAGQPAQLALSTNSLSFAFVQGANPGSTGISINNSGGGGLAFTATAASDQNWLSVSPAGGTATPSAPVNLNATATPGSLGPGTYSGNISVTSSTTGKKANIAVTMTIASAQNKILLSQTGLNFAAVVGGGKPLSQSIGILNTGSGSLNWTAKGTSTTGGPISWLSVSVPSGSVPRPYLDVSLIDVSIDSSNMTPGDYYGQIEVQSSGADNSPQYVTVVLSVKPKGSALPPEIRPTGLIFTGLAGTVPGSQSVLIGNSNAAVASYNSNALTLDGANWLAYLPANAAIDPNQPAAIIVQPDFTPLTSSGVYRGTVNLLFSDFSALQLKVLAVLAPTSGSGAERRRDGISPASGCSPNSLQMLYTGSYQALNSTAGAVVNLQVKVVDNCGNALISAPNSAVSASFSNGDPHLGLVHTGGGTWSNTWQLRDVSGSGQVTVRITAVVALTAGKVLANQIDVPLTLPSAIGTTPLIASGGTVNGATFAPGGTLAPGTLVTIFGSRLADGSAQSAGAPFATNLANTEVRLNDRPLPLLYASDGQINAQIPYDIPSNAPLQLLIRRGSAQSYPETITVGEAAPGVFTDPGTGRPIITNPGGDLNSPASPAHRGDTVVIYCTGLGQVRPAIAAGSAASSATPTVNPVTVTIDGDVVTPAYAGLTPGFAGLYQVNVTLPQTLKPNNFAQLIVTVANQSSPPVVLAVQ
jgi:uncharacterized protein (TIGR03437 family)